MSDEGEERELERGRTREDKGSTEIREGGEDKREREEEREESSGSCRLPFSDSASDNAFIMGKGEQRKGLIHRCVRES